jgi:3',5'-cyclic AMP phosphodiesterase CpdA
MKRHNFLLPLILFCLIVISCKSKIGEAPETETKVKSNPTFIHLSDVHLNAFAESCTYGGDTGTDLWSITKIKLSSILNSDPAPEFVVYTGDLPAHYSCQHNSCYLAPNTPERATHEENLKTILDDMRSLVDDNKIPFFYMPGNNDAIGGDYYSFTDGKGNTPLSLVDTTGVIVTFPALNTNAHCGNPPCIQSSPHPSMGYYSVKAIDGLRIIAMNSIILGKEYHALDGVDQTEAGNTQMKWIGDELKAAKAAGDKVYIAMHIPPGEDAYGVTHEGSTNMWAHLPAAGKEWQDQFLTLCDNFQATIAGILYGHTHMDEVRRLYASDGKTITEVAISAPGITPQHYNNPGFKIVSFDPMSFELTDFVTQYSTPQAKTWGDKSYRFSEKFGCSVNSTIYSCLSSRSLTEVSDSMDLIYTVMNGDTTYNPGSGIDIMFGQ